MSFRTPFPGLLPGSATSSKMDSGGGGGSRKSSRDEKTKRRVLPRIPKDVAPVLPRPSSAKRSFQNQDSTLDLTNVTELSQSTILEAGSIIGGVHPPKRDFVSPVKLLPSEEGVDSSVTVAVRVRPLSDRCARLHVKILIGKFKSSVVLIC